VSRHVFEIDQGLLGFSLVDPGTDIDTITIADFTAFSCQVTTAALNSTPNSTNKTTPATWCEPEATESVPGITSYEVAATFLQDPDLAAGISEFLYEHDAELVYFFMGFAGDDPPKATGRCYAVAGALGGDPRTPLTMQVTLPCRGKPIVMFGNATTSVIIGGGATGATAGSPGAWTPSGSDPPANLAALTAASPPVVASPTTAWTSGQYVVLGDASHAHWSGTAWVTGSALMAAGASSAESVIRPARETD
jgi:hypothetical protein